MDLELPVPRQRNQVLSQQWEGKTKWKLVRLEVGIHWSLQASCMESRVNHKSLKVELIRDLQLIIVCKCEGKCLSVYREFLKPCLFFWACSVVLNGAEVL